MSQNSLTEIIEQPEVIIDERGNFVMETNSFALWRFNMPLSLQQQRIFFWVFSMVGKDEPINAIATYKISIPEMSRYLNIDQKSFKRNITKVVSDFDEIDLHYNPPATVNVGDTILEKGFGVFDKISITKSEPNIIQVRLTPSFRERIIKMKKFHEIEYPIKTIMHIKSRYTTPLYTHLIALISIQREKLAMQGRPPQNRYTIALAAQELRDIMQFEGSTSKFNQSVLPSVMRDLDSTELAFDRDDPQVVKQGKTITEYIFHVKVITSTEAPIFVKSVLAEGVDSDIPGMDYIIGKLKLMGVADSFCKRVRFDNDRIRAWGNLLYSILPAHGGRSARYFNAAYTEDYYASCGKPIPYVFRCVTSDPECAWFTDGDEFIQALDNEYDRSGWDNSPSFTDEMYKHLMRTKEVSGKILPQRK